LIGLIQRVSEARVEVEQQTIASIHTGIVALIGVEKSDSEAQADRLLERILGYRIFPDTAGKMNLSLTDIGGGLLLVPQFTLPADTRKGMRPSFSSAAPPELGAKLFAYLLAQAESNRGRVGAGRFGADMQVTLTNDGPVTFWLQT
jgi:D-tyrosyl-tRNA(Tyr) deacylase